MLTDSKVMAFVNRVGKDATLQDDLARDFDGTVARTGLQLSAKERDALRASWQFLREFKPGRRDEYVMLGGSIGC
ncbi:MAG: hypothetical protein HY692_02190 [Cyanobacteria bacterium NC_groundwater_1444_Ag_S-0.65um_54_12]|nr:hypothetical protein [Cyanobacteria bacterium NC_groundwater_1444_Ag_S-0.65um_54_12]